VKLGKSATETLEMLREAFVAHSLSRRKVFLNGIHVSRPIECQMKITELQGDKSSAKPTQIVEKNSRIRPRRPSPNNP
jgi:hypothetical protein